MGLDNDTRDEILELVVRGQHGAALDRLEKAKAAEADVEAPGDLEEGSSWDEFTVTELRAELESRELETSGRKAELVKRLEDDDEANAVPETVVA